MNGLYGRFRIDLVVERLVVLELKSVERLERIHQAQSLSYLRATGIGWVC